MRDRCLIVIPAYNEADTIGELVTRASVHADVCVVDDASTDGTGAIVESISGARCITHESNTHIPGAILDGFRHADENDYPYCITMDAGLSHDPDAIPDFLAVEDADLVLGCRTDTFNVPVRRRLLSWTATTLMNAAISRGDAPGDFHRIRDASSGYRMYSRPAYQLVLEARLWSRSFDFHIESLARIARAGLRIAEVPISYRYTNSSLRFKVLTDALSTFSRIWVDDLP